MIEQIFTPDALVALLTLTALEIVLGIDNVVFIAILTARLPIEKQPLAYRIGLAGALVTRIGLLFAISWVMGLTEVVFEVFDHGFSGRDMILMGGGLFLIGKATHEIHHKLELPEDEQDPSFKDKKQASMVFTVAQIMVLDIVFSLDSVITAVGMAKDLWVMVTAMVIAVAVMLIFAERIGKFVNTHPSMKLLALSFLLLIGVLLTAEAMGQHVDKGYIYFAMGFALVVELMNMRMRKAALAKRAATRAEQGGS